MKNLSQSKKEHALTDEYYGFGNNDYKKTTKVPILNIAAKNGNVEIVKLLLGYPNIDINAKDNKGKTAINVAKNQEIKTLILNAQKKADRKSVV